MSKWAFKQIEPQPARGKLQDSMWTDPLWIAEEKYDGDRRIAQFCDKAVRFTGRRVSVTDGLFVEKTRNVPHLSGTYDPKTIVLPGGVTAPPSALDGTVLDGEMICGADVSTANGGMSKYVTSIMGSLPEEAVRKQIERGWLRYVVFDCLFYKGKDVRQLAWDDRRAFATDAVSEWGNPFALIAPYATCNKLSFRHEILHRGGEGVILKHVDHKYGQKNRWVKVKAEWTADVVIMGFEDAKAMSVKKGDDAPSMTKYAKAGLIGAIRCGQYGNRTACSDHMLIEIATVSGMDDDLRRKFTSHPKGYIGQVIEIAHNGREPTGRFRHPRFKRFRDDKAAADCVYRDGEI